jgi:hypothetical protein
MFFFHGVFTLSFSLYSKHQQSALDKSAALNWLNSDAWHRCCVFIAESNMLEERRNGNRANAYRYCSSDLMSHPVKVPRNG